MKSTCWDTRATDSIIKSGRKDTEESIAPLSLNVLILIEMFHDPGDVRMPLFTTKERTPDCSDL